MHLKNEIPDNTFLIYKNNELTYFGNECDRIPSVLGNVYGQKTRRLDLSFNCLTSLEGLESFITIEELILDNNLLDDNVQFGYKPFLHTLSLNKNRFSDLDKLLTQIKENFPQLKFLSLLGNTACPNQLSSDDKDEDDYYRYRFYVIFNMPNLKFLDSTKVRNDERRQAFERGAYMKVVRPSQETLNSSAIEESRNILSPLPIDYSNEGTHSTSFGRLRHRYTGKHSEGNRFIKNHEL